jgi:hypothetical protein
MPLNPKSLEPAIAAYRNGRLNAIDTLRWLAENNHLPESAFRLSAEPAVLRVNEIEEVVALTPDELLTGYLPFVNVLMQLHLEPARRTLVALAGIPGSGKSVFLAVIQQLWTALGLPRILRCVSMDGYHYPNHYLQTHPNPDAPGETLIARKGSIHSFDAASLARDLRAIRDGQTETKLPAYDRRVHDPRPDAVTIQSTDRIVCVEGNYLLVNQVPWDAVDANFAVRAFLDMPLDTAKTSLIERLERGGEKPEAARHRFETNDRFNTDLVIQYRPRADLIIKKDADHRVIAVEKPDSA